MTGVVSVSVSPPAACAPRSSEPTSSGLTASEHILLGLVYVDDAVANRILLGFQAYPDEIRDAVIGTLSGSGASAS
jgi:hypothetical protein